MSGEQVELKARLRARGCSLKQYGGMKWGLVIGNDPIWQDLGFFETATDPVRVLHYRAEGKLRVRVIASRDEIRKKKRWCVTLYIYPEMLGKSEFDILTKEMFELLELTHIRRWRAIGDGPSATFVNFIQLFDDEECHGCDVLKLDPNR